MVVKNLKNINVHIFIPPTDYPNYKITITRSDGTVDDITDLLTEEGNLTDSINDQIGNFSFIIDNSTEEYTNVWTNGDVLRFYADYATSATTLRFRGVIEKVSYPNNTVQITGRTDALDLLNLLITYSTTDETSVILTYLFNTYATKFTLTNVNTSTITMAVDWYQKPMMECIMELCNKAGYDFYVDCNLDVHYFESGSVMNSNEAVVHDSGNIFSIDDFGTDSSLIKNKITVQGVSSSGLPVLWTESSTDGAYGINSSLGVRHKIIPDNSIRNILQAEDRAEAELLVAMDTNSEGIAECVGIATIQPGEKIPISAPYSGLNPNYYTIPSYTHKLGGDIFKTEITINKSSLTFQKLLKRSTDWATSESSEKVSSYDDNISAMEFSYNINFEQDSGTHSSTLVSGNYLRTNGASSGVWESDVEETSFDVTAVVLKVNGDNLSTIKVFVSLDGGSVYKQIYGENCPEIQTLTSGRSIKIKIFLNSADTQIRGMSLLYK